jgi:hypothetical protein
MPLVGHSQSPLLTPEAFVLKTLIPWKRRYRVGIAERDEWQTGFARASCPSDLNKQILVTKTEQIMFRQKEARQLVNMEGAWLEGTRP